ncbi:hypothetical protein V3C99_010962, partial [Haemonchus contortus]
LKMSSDHKSNSASNDDQVKMKSLHTSGGGSGQQEKTTTSNHTSFSGLTRSSMEDSASMITYTEPTQKSSFVAVLMEKESTSDIFWQTLIPFMVGGLGSVACGLIVNRAQKTDLVCEVPHLIAICVPLQGMKGNLDMTFTSRLGTMAHRGRLRDSGYARRILRSIALLEAQGIFISLFSVLITFALEGLLQSRKKQPPVGDFLFLGSNSLFAMCIASAISSVAMVVLVVYSYRKAINPDNIGTPIAASCGDLLTIMAMLLIGVFYYPIAMVSNWISCSVMAAFLATTPFFLFIAHKDDEAWIAARQQGPTFLLAAILSSAAGLVQAYGAMSFPELTVYQPLVAATSGNRASVQSARISSYLNTYKGPNRLKMRLNPWIYYTSADHESRAAFLILMTSVPYQLAFVLLSHAVAYVALTPLRLNILFLLGYLITVFIQSFILLYLAEVVVYSLFHFGIDPDLHAIPLLTSIGDLLGTALLFVLFLWTSISPEVVVVSEPPSDPLANATKTCSYE